MISIGTEQLVLDRKVPKDIENYMRVPFQQGTFDLPISYGYALCGVLEDSTKVHLMHPHQNKCIVDKASIFSHCQDLPLHRIPLISNMETVINAIWDAGLKVNSQVVICGFGSIGSLLATTLKHHYHIKVKIVESDEWRQKKAVELGFDLHEKQNGFDIAFNTTANEKALQFCIDHANEEGRIIELSWYGSHSSTLKLGANFHKNRLRLIASQVSKIPLKKQCEFDFFKRKALAADYLLNDNYDSLITHEILFEDTPLFFNSLRRNSFPQGLIHLIKY